MKIRWNKSGKSLWDRHAADAPVQQQWAFGAALEAVGAPVMRAVVEDGGGPRALAQFSLGTFAGLAVWAMCTRGPVWVGDVPDSERAEILRRLRREIPLRRPRAIFFLPDAPLGAAFPRLAGLRQVMTGFNCVDLNIARDLDDLRAGMHGKWRNRLRAAEKAGLRIVDGGGKPRQYQWLLDAEAAQKQSKGYLSPPVTLAPAYQRAAGDRHAIRVLSAEDPQDAGTPIAAVMLMSHGRGATYHIGWSSERGRRCGAHSLLLWEGIKRLREDGVRRFDLGEADTAKGAGLARFKLGVGARPVTLCGAYM